MASKPAIRSLGVWGGLTTLLPLLYKLIGALSDIPTDLITDTQTFFITTVAAAVALFGRWRAALPIKGILFGKDR